MSGAFMEITVEKDPQDMDKDELVALVQSLRMANESLMEGANRLEEDLLFWQSLLGVAIFKHGDNHHLLFTDQDCLKMMNSSAPFVWYSRSEDSMGLGSKHKVELLTEEEIEQKKQGIQPEAGVIVVPGKALN